MNKELTTNQQHILEAIAQGHQTFDEIVANTTVSKSAITAVLNSLVKRELIQKLEDNCYVLPPTSEAAPKEKTTMQFVAPEKIDEVIETSDQLISVVIPYLKSEAAGEELRYALRAWERHFQEDFQVVIVGDKEDWFSPNVIHIPAPIHLIKEDCGCPSPSMIRNPQADVTYKLLTAIASGVVQGNFILSNDDIYLLGHTTLADIASLKAYDTLDKAGKVGGVYNQNAQRTAKALTANQKPIHRYGTHTPMLLHAEQLANIIEKYNALENGYLLTSLYFNELYPDARPIQIDGGIHDKILASVYRADVDPKVLRDVFAKRKFLNCDSKGWIAIRPILEELYTEKSRFEK